MIKTKLGYFSIFGAILIFLLGTNPTRICAKTDLFVEGNVIGYVSYNRSIPQLWGTCLLMIRLDPVIVKVTKVLDGAEESEYLQVLTHNFGEGYANDNYGLDKISTFNLVRGKNCDEKLKSLISPVTIKIGKRVETYKSFTLVPDFEKKSLPLNKKIPCYLETPKV